MRPTHARAAALTAALALTAPATAHGGPVPPATDARVGAAVSEPVYVSPTVPSVSRTPVGAERPVAVHYAAPVGAPVRDPFRAPATPYGPGNRGTEYAASPGEEVRAAAGGTVTFAGPVAAGRHVTVLHADRARTTYSGLAAIHVAEGDTVAAGEVVGTAAGPVLWSVRLGEAYLDPAVLLAASGTAAARLVPVPGDETGIGDR